MIDKDMKNKQAKATSIVFSSNVDLGLSTDRGISVLQPPHGRRLAGGQDGEIPDTVLNISTIAHSVPAS